MLARSLRLPAVRKSRPKVAQAHSKIQKNDSPVLLLLLRSRPQPCQQPDRPQTATSIKLQSV